jgi:hypothetical protein
MGGGQPASVAGKGLCLRRSVLDRQYVERADRDERRPGPLSERDHRNATTIRSATFVAVRAHAATRTKRVQGVTCEQPVELRPFQTLE